MAIKVNDSVVSLTVRDLVISPENSLLSSFPLPQRGKLGRDTQSQIQKNRTRQTGLFHSEYPVTSSFNFDPFTVIIQGRRG